jgi:hypothetical protein
MTDLVQSITETITTVIVPATLGESIGTVSKLLEAHRGYAQHQLCVMGDAVTAAGDWDILFMPDSDEIVQNLTVDTGQNLTITGKKSDFITFTALLRGIVISEATAGTTGRTLTFVLSSMRGPLINS